MTTHWAMPLPSTPDYAHLARVVADLLQMRNEHQAIRIRQAELRRQIKSRVAELECLQRRRTDIERAFGFAPSVRGDLDEQHKRSEQS